MPSDNRRERTGSIRWIPLALMRISPLAQRELKMAWVREIADELDPERLGIIAVSHRDGSYFVIDGQHRVEAMRLVGWGDQQVQCDVYEGLTEAKEAEAFLVLNHRRNVTAFDQFRIGAEAGRPEETDITHIVHRLGLRVSRGGSDSITAVTGLRQVYRAGGPDVLARTLGIVRDSYGPGGASGAVIVGVGLVCQRYNGQLDVPAAVAKLAAAPRGALGLMQKATTIQLATGNSKAHCVAAAVVEIVNTGRGGKKLPPWWREDPE